jgi:hypothetical protein
MTTPPSTTNGLVASEAPSHDEGHDAGRLSDRMFRALTVAVVPLATFTVFRGWYRAISDPDTFWHLRLGDYLSTTWNFSGPEPWSALADGPLVLHEWAPQLAYIAAFRLGGYSALAWLQAAGAVCFFLTLYACARRFAPALIAALTTVMGFAGASGSVGARPQMVSFVLLAVFTAAWMATAHDARIRWWLVPLTWVWACSHGMWFAGPAIGLVVIVGMLLDRTIGMRAAARLSLVPLLGVLAAALTPVGPPLLLTAGNMSDYTHHVAEWQPPSIFLPQSLYALALAAVVLLLWTRSRGKVPWTELALWGSGLVLTLMYVRTIALGAIILSLLAASVLARHVTVGETRVPSRRLEAVVVTVGTIAVLLLGPVVVRTDVSQPTGVPLALSPALQGLPEGAVVFNDYGLGGWLLWAHPNLDPVIDGRADVYDLAYFDRTMNAYTVPQGWQDTVRDSGATAALLPSESPLAEGLRSSLGWTSVGEDEGIELLVPPS